VIPTVMIKEMLLVILMVLLLVVDLMIMIVVHLEGVDLTQLQVIHMGLLAGEVDTMN